MKSEKSNNHHTFGTRTTTTRKSSVKMLWNWIPATLALAVLVILTTMTDSAHGQRRPSTSPGMEAYRNRWLAYLKAQSTTTVAPFRASNPNNPIINGFECERTHSFFSNRNNPRMYHFCARNRDSWYVYHYFCPQGSIFNEGNRKCMQDRGEDDISGGNGNSNPTNVANNRRPGNVPPRRGPNQSPFLHRPRPTRPTVSPSTPSTTPTTPSTTPTTRRTTTTTTEEPEPNPEPDSDHVSVTEFASVSSEEASTEDGVDVVVSVPGGPPGHQAIESPPQHQNLDVVEEEQATRKENNDDQVNMVIPESVNGPSRLVAVKTTPPPRVSTSSSKSKPTKRIPSKAAKIATSDEEPDSLGDDDELMTTTLSEAAAGSRRPRILKKKKYWRNFLLGKLY